MTKRKVVAVTAMVILLAGWMSRASLLTFAAAWLNVGTAPQHTDYVYVLNGDVNVRPFIGAAVVNSGYTSQVLLVPMAEPGQTATDSTPATHEIARRVMVHQGVSANKFKVIDGNVKSTFDEAEALKRFLASSGNDDTTVSVVTSDFHTRRTRWVFHRVFGDGSDRLRFIAAPTDGYGATNWWRVEDGFMTYGTEFLKFGFYLFRYGNGLLISGGVAAAIVAGVCYTTRKRRLDGVGVIDA